MADETEGGERDDDPPVHPGREGDDGTDQPHKDSNSPPTPVSSSAVPAVRTDTTIFSTASEADPFQTGPSPDFSITTLMTGEDNKLVAASYEGLLPPPSHLQEYEKIVRGAARKIISWVPAESNHRRQLESKYQKHRIEMEVREAEHRIALENKGMELAEKALGWGIFRANLGMILAWPLVIGIVSAGTYLISTGHDTAGTILVESTLAVVGGGYLLQRLAKIRKSSDGRATNARELDVPGTDED